MSTGRQRVPGVPVSSRRDRDEDLLLFKEMFKRERERTVSLLQPVSDEFEPTQGNHHLYKIPTGKKSSDPEEKNDYDWLKTPPATPLFPSLELEANENLANMIVHKELPILQPIKPSRGPSRFSNSIEATKSAQRPKSPSSSSASSSRSVTPRLKPSSMVNGKTTTKMTMQMNSRSLDQKTNESKTNKSINPPSIPSTPKNTKEVPSKPRRTTTLPEFTIQTTRGRVGNTGETMEVKQGANRRLSCSPRMMRGIKSELIEEENVKFAKMKAQEKNNNGSMMAGSRMVDRVMNARRLTTLSGEKDAKIKGQDDAGFARFMSKTSLDKALENLDDKRIGGGIRSSNVARNTKHRFNVENKTPISSTKKVDDKRNKFGMS
ncbi:hypothetical protein J5N97_020177 [Dioscorea zingiberensis]|uniref:Uncharacterized protein n=1 Tax=Dioscorea zingiberensis TaxID=325984 RepID=A0A9D5CGJ0_9LILI|nr:hypothetical protein J5N97_020177 [Dioscorea zingiberensis]